MSAKFQVRLSSNRRDLLIVNTQPLKGRRWSVVGIALTMEEAREYAAALNRQEKRIAAKK